MYQHPKLELSKADQLIGTEVCQSIGGVFQHLYKFESSVFLARSKLDNRGPMYIRQESTAFPKPSASLVKLAEIGFTIIGICNNYYRYDTIINRFRDKLQAVIYKKSMQEQAPTQPPKKEKKPKATFAVKPEHFENRNGLRKLYELTNEVNWKENIPVEAAMNLVTVTLKTWHYQLMPKYSFDYFLQRCQALGNNKLVSAYMSRVRRIHRGVEFWPETQPTNTNKQQKQEFTQRVEMVQEQASVHHNKPQTDKIEQEEAYDEELKLFEQMSQKRKMKKEQPEEKGVDLEPCDIDIDYDYE